MKATSSLLSVLLAAPLLSSLAASSPVSNTRTHQIVFADVEDATRLDSNLHQGDLVDSMIAEAKSKGQDLSSWGINTINDDQVVGQAFTESVDLDDQVAQAKLMWEAAMEDAVVSIQPVKAKATKVVHDSVNAKLDPPGSGWVWQACGSGQEAAVLHELNVDPDPPLAGKNLTVKAKGIVNSPIHVSRYLQILLPHSVHFTNFHFTHSLK